MSIGGDVNTRTLSELIGPSEVSFELRIPASSLRKLADRGLIPYQRVGLHRVFRREDLPAIAAAAAATVGRQSIRSRHRDGKGKA